MTVVVAADIHGSASWTRRLLEACEAEHASQLLLLGDLLYHGPRNPLPEGYDPKETAMLLNSFADRIMAVRGNCDAEVDSLMLRFPLVESAMLFMDGLRFFCTHGHRSDLSDPSLPMGYDVLLSGHTHLYAGEKREGRYFFNPGSVSLPKGGNAHSYLVYRDHVCTIKDFSHAVLYSALAEKAGQPIDILEEEPVRA